MDQGRMGRLPKGGPTVPDLKPPRTYWCHLDQPGEPTGRPFKDLMALTAPEAIDWMREGVRGVVANLDRTEFHRAWSWLGNHRDMHGICRSLRTGSPYTLTIKAESRTWNWTVHPVRTLPTLDLGHKPQCIPWTRD